MTTAPAPATARSRPNTPRSRGVARKIRVPAPNRSTNRTRPLGRARGTRAETTRAAEARNPAAVPANNHGKSTTVNTSAATTGLSSVSRLDASCEADKARV